MDRLIAEPDLAKLLMFKGGTSLSKAYGLIERFYEEIDLILDGWNMLSATGQGIRRRHLLRYESR